jgi:hypothetical protein
LQRCSLRERNEPHARFHCGGSLIPPTLVSPGGGSVVLLNAPGFSCSDHGSDAGLGSVRRILPARNRRRNIFCRKATDPREERRCGPMSTSSHSRSVRRLENRRWCPGLLCDNGVMLQQRNMEASACRCLRACAFVRRRAQVAELIVRHTREGTGALGWARCGAASLTQQSRELSR